VRTYELTACPACRAGGYDDLTFSPTATLRRCRACDLVFAPAYGDPTDIYVDGYLRGETDFGLDIMHPLFQEYLDHVAHRRLALIEKTVRPGRFLDVGCGTGEVLAAARERGWDVKGAEPVEDSASFAVRERGLDVRAALLEESGLPRRSYDVVSAFHVLEHMTDGLGFLRSISRWARPGGWVVIEVPNYGSIHRRGYGGGWPGLRPLEHVAHYTPATLAAIMHRAGLEPVRVHTPGFIWHRQTFDQAIADLGAQRFGKWFRRARVLTGPGEQDGQPAVVPTRLGWWALESLQSAYAAARKGMVVLALGQVPIDADAD
jgi:2-polyprenyl-3-methyl-5-hydroxy-6-metoxy-1,4-benzoquinol methylase